MRPGLGRAGISPSGSTSAGPATGRQRRTCRGCPAGYSRRVPATVVESVTKRPLFLPSGRFARRSRESSGPDSAIASRVPGSAGFSPLASLVPFHLSAPTSPGSATRRPAPADDFPAVRPIACRPDPYPRAVLARRSHGSYAKPGGPGTGSARCFARTKKNAWKLRMVHYPSRCASISSTGSREILVGATTPRTEAVK